MKPPILTETENSLTISGLNNDQKETLSQFLKDFILDVPRDISKELEEIKDLCKREVEKANIPLDKIDVTFGRGMEWNDSHYSVNIIVHYDLGKAYDLLIDTLYDVELENYLSTLTKNKEYIDRKVYITINSSEKYYNENRKIK